MLETDLREMPHRHFRGLRLTVEVNGGEYWQTTVLIFDEDIVKVELIEDGEACVRVNDAAIADVQTMPLPENDSLPSAADSANTVAKPTSPS